MSGGLCRYILRMQIGNLANGPTVSDLRGTDTTIDAAHNDDCSTGSLNATGAGLISTTGTTQFRVYFSTPTNNDGVDDYIAWYSGDNTTSANRPVLELSYTKAGYRSASGADSTHRHAGKHESCAQLDGLCGNGYLYGLRSSTSGSGYAAVGPALTGTTFTDPNLTNGTVYYYVVTATNGAGTSPNSAQATARPRREYFMDSESFAIGAKD